MDFIERYKKLLLALGFVVLVILLGYLIYKVLFSGYSELPGQDSNVSTSTAGGGLPTAGSGGQNQVIDPGANSGLQGSADPKTQPLKEDEPTASGAAPTIDVSSSRTYSVSSGLNGSIKYYNPDDGKFYKLDGNDKPTAMSDKTFYQVKDVTWSPTKDKAILEYPDGTKTIYDFSKNKQVTLPEHWEDFSFSPSGDGLVMKSIGNDPDNRWLVTTNDDGGNIKALEQIANPSVVYPSWSPNKQIIAMYTESTGIDKQEVYFVGQNKENFKSTIIEGRDFRPLWSPEGDRLFYSVYSEDSDLKPSLWVVDAQGDGIGANRQPLNLETWADKCTFANQTTVYCAVPNTLQRGAGMFPQMAQNTPDTLYRINTVTGAKEQVAVPEGSHTISEITTSKDGNQLYFNDTNTGHLYKIDIK